MGIAVSTDLTKVALPILLLVRLLRASNELTNFLSKDVDNRHQNSKSLIRQVF